MKLKHQQTKQEFDKKRFTFVGTFAAPGIMNCDKLV
jgi:hypothetical protein